MPRHESALDEQALMVNGFFGGFAITALVVIIRAPRAFHVAIGPPSADEYFQALTTSIAIVASVCTFGVLAAMEIAGGLGVIPLLLLPFSQFGSLILTGLEIILLTIYFANPAKTTPKTRR